MLLILHFLLLFGEQPDPGPFCNSCRSLTIAYTAHVNSKHRNKTLAELYDGSAKVLYLTRDSIQIRQVSLLRRETITMYRTNKGFNGKVLQESSTAHRTYPVSEQDWERSFAPFIDASCDLDSSSQNIIGYLCKKAVLYGRDGQRLIAYYTTSLRHTAYAIAEPMFACLPGVVLKYEFRTKESVITYTANRIRVQ